MSLFNFDDLARKYPLEFEVMRREAEKACVGIDDEIKKCAIDDEIKKCTTARGAIPPEAQLEFLRARRFKVLESFQDALIRVLEGRHCPDLVERLTVDLECQERRKEIKKGKDDENRQA